LYNILQKLLQQPGFFQYNFFKSVINRKEPEPQFVITASAPASAPASVPGSKVILAPLLSAPAHNTAFIYRFAACSGALWECYKKLKNIKAQSWRQMRYYFG
jgi:hypothetical protein